MGETDEERGRKIIMEVIEEYTGSIILDPTDSAVLFLTSARNTEFLEVMTEHARICWNYLKEAGIRPEKIDTSEPELLEMMGISGKTPNIALLFAVLSLPSLPPAA